MTGWQIILKAVLAVHVVAAILWIGALYFGQYFQPRTRFFQPGEGPPSSLPVRVGTLAVLFWSAITTLVSGGLWIVLYRASQAGWGYFSSTSFHAIAVGGGVGTLMVGNTWLVVSRNQQKVDRARAGGQPDPIVIERHLGIIAVASRINLVVSFTAIAFMVLAGAT